MVFIFLTKLQVGVSSSTKDVFLSKYFSRFLLGFVVIYQNLPENVYVVAANSCKVFKIFIPKKIIYSGPDIIRSEKTYDV